MWSVDAHVMVRPAATFERLAAQEPAPGHAWIALRRPLCLMVTLGCLISLFASGTLTLRLAGPTALYWGFVPAAEVLGFVAVAGRRRPRPLSRLIDLFFAGHAPWTLFLMAFAAAIANASPDWWWVLMTSVVLPAMGLVIAWSAYVDGCFFRRVMGASRGAAVRDVVLHRAITWTIVFVIFAVPSLSGLGAEFAEIAAELFR